MATLDRLSRALLGYPQPLAELIFELEGETAAKLLRAAECGSSCDNLSDALSGVLEMAKAGDSTAIRAILAGARAHNQACEHMLTMLVREDNELARDALCTTLKALLSDSSASDLWDQNVIDEAVAVAYDRHRHRENNGVIWCTCTVGFDDQVVELALWVTTLLDEQATRVDSQIEPEQVLTRINRAFAYAKLLNSKAVRKARQRRQEIHDTMRNKGREQLLAEVRLEIDRKTDTI